MKYVLTIGKKGHSGAGRPLVTSSHDTRDEAFARLVEYLKRNWEGQMNTEADTLLPENAEEMVDAYFAQVLESYEIVEVSESKPVARGTESQKEPAGTVDELERRIRELCWA